jgi:hypothetical protein
LTLWPGKQPRNTRPAHIFSQQLVESSQLLHGSCLMYEYTILLFSLAIFPLCSSAVTLFSFFPYLPSALLSLTYHSLTSLYLPSHTLPPLSLLPVSLPPLFQLPFYPSSLFLSPHSLPLLSVLPIPLPSLFQPPVTSLPFPALLSRPFHPLPCHSLPFCFFPPFTSLRFSQPSLFLSSVSLLYIFLLLLNLSLLLYSWPSCRSLPCVC